MFLILCCLYDVSHGFHLLIWSLSNQNFVNWQYIATILSINFCYGILSVALYISKYIKLQEELNLRFQDLLFDASLYTQISVKINTVRCLMIFAQRDKQQKCFDSWLYLCIFFKLYFTLIFFWNIIYYNIYLVKKKRYQYNKN